MVNKRAGRPQGTPTARQALIDAAQRHIDMGDLVAASSRQLAREAGVSHTLVNYHFGSRSALVAAAVGFRVAPHDVISRARGATGTIQLPRLIHGLFTLWEDPAVGSTLVAAARSYAARGEASSAIAAYLQDVVFAPLVSDFGVAQGRRMVTTIIGFLYGRYVLEIPILASLTRDQARSQLMSMLGAAT